MVPDPDIGIAVEGGHHVLVPLGACDLGRGDVLELGRLDRMEAREALEAAGIPFERSDQLAAFARRSFKSMLRRLAADPRLERPRWADSEHSAVLAPLLLVIKWSSSEADLAAVAELPGPEWSELERESRALSARADLFGWRPRLLASPDPTMMPTTKRSRPRAPRLSGDARHCRARWPHRLG